MLEKEIQKINKKIDLKEELHKEIETKNRAAILLAEELFACYKSWSLPALKEERVAYTAVDSTIDLEWGNYKSILNGKPDVVMTDGTVIDWKCQGMFGRGKVPSPGYIRCFSNGKDLGDSHTDQYLEQINYDWGIQLYLYSRLLGRKAGDPKLKAGIENITIDSKNNVYCASYRALISVDFQLSIEKQFHEKWMKFNFLNSQKPDQPTYHERRCIQYNKLCNVAEHCIAYKNRNNSQQSDGMMLLEIP
jgi:hypothetical protein